MRRSQGQSDIATPQSSGFSSDNGRDLPRTGSKRIELEDIHLGLKSSPDEWKQNAPAFLFLSQALRQAIENVREGRKPLRLHDPTQIRYRLDGNYSIFLIPKTLLLPECDRKGMTECPAITRLKHFREISFGEATEDCMELRIPWEVNKLRLNRQMPNTSDERKLYAERRIAHRGGKLDKLDCY